MPHDHLLRKHLREREKNVPPRMMKNDISAIYQTYHMGQAISDFQLNYIIIGQKIRECWHFNNGQQWLYRHDHKPLTDDFYLTRQTFHVKWWLLDFYDSLEISGLRPFITWCQKLAHKRRKVSENLPFTDSLEISGWRPFITWCQKLAHKRRKVSENLPFTDSLEISGWRPFITWCQKLAHKS